jgi:hypothetical protein
MEEVAELAVARDFILSITQDINGCNILYLSIRSSNLAKEVRIDVINYGSGIVNAERVKGITESGLSIYSVLSFLEGEIGNRGCFNMRSYCCIEEGNIVFTKSVII